LPAQENQFRRAPGADHLVVHDVRGHPHQREVPPALPDDLVAGRDRDQVGEAFEGDDVAVMHQFRDRIGQGNDCTHTSSSIVPGEVVLIANVGTYNAR
jgi:hypothetical protein